MSCFWELELQGVSHLQYIFIDIFLGAYSGVDTTLAANSLSSKSLPSPMTVIITVKMKIRYLDKRIDSKELKNNFS